MNFEKYKNHLIKKIKDQLESWFDENKNTNIPASEIYRFLHSIKGTSGTLELGGLYQLSEILLGQLDENSTKIWVKEDLRNFLFDLIAFTYQYEHFQDEIKLSEQSGNTSGPLILIIDDDVSMLILLKDILEEQGWMVIASNDPIKATAQYFEMQPDCLIIDINLPSKDGFQILEDVNKHNERHYIPKLMISSQSDRDSRIRAYNMGADDFMLKPVDIEEFTVRVRRHLLRKQLFDQSLLIDELTQVFNRRFLNQSLPRMFEGIKRNNSVFTIAMLDIDHFKKVNDTYGHLTGDKILIEFASFLKSELRSTDMVFRYGGEEFTVLFPHTSSVEVKKTLENLIASFSEKEFKANGASFTLTFSAGIYTVNDITSSPEEALKIADQSLYEAKQNGRARAVVSRVLTETSKKVMCISVIDDDVIIRSMLLRMLQTVQTEDIELDIAVYENGQKFFESNRIEESDDHFVVIDGVMPIMDGLEVLQKLKQTESKDKRISALMLTGRKNERDIARALKLGADDYVTKPFSILELQARIERLLKRA
ncbi:diguanylate cyclase [Bacillus sp. M6-12]|uniref:GGDEF domain-containing response regulator n=1 Tax=Bacillus sp. M6-12 TaxID=2054166 RepID=UPI000C76F56E|nr:diguanylate cyclase [Bacillus sp. M6-12]PLS18132.1 diguanylate cyclase [Bacillus sp. M6-12]